MSGEGNSSYKELQPSEVAIPRLVRFWLILLFDIPSLVCSLFAFYHFVFNRTLRRALHNHVIILFLFTNFIIELTDISWVLNYYRLGYVYPSTPVFCLAWIFTDETLYITTTVLFSWATIERHILIFHDRVMSTKYKRILFHYLPIMIILFYCICYNTIAVLFPPCENTFDYSQIVCGYPLCYYETRLTAIWDVIVNDLIPTIIIIVCSIALLARIFHQKHRMHRPIRWRDHRKMTIQLLSISVLYLVIYIPRMLITFVYLCGISESVGADFVTYAKFFKHFGSLLLPFICAGSLPELQTKIKKIFPCWRGQVNAVGPQIMMIKRPVQGRPMKTDPID